MELTLDQALQKGMEAHKSGNAQQADKFYTAVLKAQPKHPEASHNMGVLAVGLGKAQEALPFFKIALEGKPSVAQFWLSYIDALIKLDRVIDAEAVLAQAKDQGASGGAFDQLEQRLAEQKLKPNKTSSMALDNPASSKPSILDTIKLDEALRLAKKASKGGQIEEAKTIYKDILNNFPKNKQALVALQSLGGGATQDPPSNQMQPIIDLYTQGQLKQALTEINQMLKKFPNSVVLYNISGTSNAGLKQFDAAIDSYQKALKIKPNFAEVYSNMGAAFMQKGDPQAAIDSYQKALKINPGIAEAYQNMGNALNDMGNSVAAIDSYKKALKIRPSYADAHNSMGNALRDMGNNEAAIDSYKKAL